MHGRKFRRWLERQTKTLHAAVNSKRFYQFRTTEDDDFTP